MAVNYLYMKNVLDKSGMTNHKFIGLREEIRHRAIPKMVFLPRDKPLILMDVHLLSFVSQ